MSEAQASSDLTLAALARTLVAARVELAAQEQVLNSLNVFPVPDGDTGTNMRATLDAGLAVLVETDPDDGERTRLRRVLHALTRGAQGNSGVILSEYLRAFVTTLARLLSSPPGGDIGGDALAQALLAAAAAARGAVDRPVEGTMLSVADAAAQAARDAVFEARVGACQRATGDLDVATQVATAQAADSADIAQIAFEAAAAALARSPGQLEVLAGAGVVDAGGAGLTIVLESLARVAAARHGLPRANTRSWLPAPTPGRVSALRAENGCNVAAGGPAFEFMGVVDGLDEGAAAALRERLGQLGDSVVVAGSAGLHRVHVHTDAVLAAVTAVRERGPLSRVDITRFDGPIPALQNVLVRCRDHAVARYAQALGVRVEDPAASCPPGAVVLADAGDRPGLATGTLAHLLIALDDLALDEAMDAESRGWGEIDPAGDDLSTYSGADDHVDAGHDGDADGRVNITDVIEQTQEMEVYCACSWRAARDLARSHVAGADSVLLCFSPAARSEAAARVIDIVTGQVPQEHVEVLRLDSGSVVQMGVIRG